MRAVLAKQRRRVGGAASGPPRRLDAGVDSSRPRTAAVQLDDLQWRAQFAPPDYVPPREVKSYSIQVDDWASVPCWRSRSHWLDVLQEMAATDYPGWVEARGQQKMAARTVLEIARVFAEAADGRTGRHVTISYDTVRARLLANTQNSPGRTIRLKCNSSIQKTVRILLHVGMLKRLALGCDRFTREQKAEAFHTHGGHQSAAANVFACTLPTPATREAEPPTKPVDNRVCVETISALSPNPDVNALLPVNSTRLSPRGMERATRAGSQQKRVISERSSAYVPEVPRSPHRQELFARLDLWSSGKPILPHPAPETPAYGHETLRGSLLQVTYRKDGQPRRSSPSSRLEQALLAAGVDIDTWKWWQIAEQLEAQYGTEKLTAAARISVADTPLDYFIWMVRNTPTLHGEPRTMVPYTRLNPYYQPPAPAPTTEPAPPTPAQLNAERAATERTIDAMHQAHDAELDRKRQKRIAESRGITYALLGTGARPSDERFSPTARDLHNEIQTLHAWLTNHGWTIDPLALQHGDIHWNDHTTADSYTNATSIRFVPPTTNTPDPYRYNLTQTSTTNLLLTLPQLYDALHRRQR